MSTQDSISNTPTLQVEIWKPVVGYEDLYKVSNFGRVKRVKIGKGVMIDRIMTPELFRGGYLRVTLSNRKPKRFVVHRLVARAFIGEPPTPKHEINHINSNRTDNRVENLEWLTPLENMQHARKFGGLALQKGENHPMAILNWESVRNIRQMIKEGETQRSIAKMYGVHYSTIHLIKANKHWTENNSLTTPTH